LSKCVSIFGGDGLSTILTNYNNEPNGGPKIRMSLLALVREDNTPPLCWPLGRAQEVHPGNDGVVRTVTIKTAKGRDPLIG